jgi:hypothetical protein
MPTFNFERCEEVLDDINNNAKVEKTVTSPPNFLVRVENI